jgi:hypothetical protein
MNAGKAVRRKRRVVGRIDVHQADGNEEAERDQLDHHHHVVGGGALARATQQQPRDQHDDAERRHVDQDRHPADLRRRVE